MCRSREEGMDSKLLGASFYAEVEGAHPALAFFGG
jgi:hypothetical protein